MHLDRFAGALVVACAGCSAEWASPDAARSDAEPTALPDAAWRLEWGAPRAGALELPPCPGGHPADTAVAQARAPWDEAPFDARNLLDGFRLPALDALRTDPLRARCLAAWAPVDDRPSAWLDAAARLAGDPPHEAVSPDRDPELDAVLAAMTGAFGVEPEVRVRRASPSIERAVAVIAWAALDAVLVQDDGEEPVRGGEWWARHGGAGLLYDADGQGYNAAYASDRAFLERDRGRMYAAAIRLAEAVESVDWPTGAEQGVLLDVATTRGRVLVRGVGDDRWEADGPRLVSIDLGGRDRYLEPVGANAGAMYPVSVHVDVGGDDVYAYPEAESVDGAEQLPADAAGRFDLARRGVDVSASVEGTQGSGRSGIGLLYDLEGNDEYRALRMSQGYAHHGVGVLYDAWGDDDYRLEDGGQGAAQYGIALHLDADGDDVRRAVSRAQGHGFVGGVGISVDRAGADAYVCDPQAPLVHPSEQLPDRNVSFCQGAGFGWRHDDPDLSLAGGLGWLLDRTGDDRYEAGVFAQGVGYWQGLGVLDDRSGHDAYEAAYYARGSGLHFGVGVALEWSGDDEFGVETAPPLSDGSGHDYGLGLFWDLSGHDDLDAGPWSGGAGSCGGVGVRIDEGGDDDYRGSSAALGAATTEACPGRRAAGRFWDGGGRDTYAGGPADARRNGREWRHAAGEGADARGHDEADVTPY